MPRQHQNYDELTFFLVRIKQPLLQPLFWLNGNWKTLKNRTAICGRKYYRFICRIRCIDILKSSDEAKYLLALEKRYSSLLRHKKFVECLSGILATHQILNAIIHLSGKKNTPCCPALALGKCRAHCFTTTKTTSHPTQMGTCPYQTPLPGYQGLQCPGG